MINLTKQTERNVEKTYTDNIGFDSRSDESKDLL